MNVAQLLVRWRVRMGYPLAILVLWVSRPVPRSILSGAILGAIGLFVRARAAGYLHKQEVLTVSGPYAYTRNPLYLGSAILTLGVAVAAPSWMAAAILCGYFALVYGVVMPRGEQGTVPAHRPPFPSISARGPLVSP